MSTEEKPPAKKGKKRPSDFEIVRTILQRSHERKLPFAVKNLGEDPDLLFLCSAKEDEFTYGSPDLSIAIFEWTSDELKAIVDSVLGKMVGFSTSEDISAIVNIREQFSLLTKTKGEQMDVELENSGLETWWYNRVNEKGELKPVYLSKGIHSLYHTRQVGVWCERYRHLLDSDNPDYLFYTYTHPEGSTGEVLTLAAPDPAHPMGVLYPHGFRTMVTRGKDVILDKFIAALPFPITRQDLIVFPLGPGVAQIVHRVIADGWRMILLRPHAVIFPTVSTPIPSTGTHVL